MKRKPTGTCILCAVSKFFVGSKQGPVNIACDKQKLGQNQTLSINITCLMKTLQLSKHQVSDIGRHYIYSGTSDKRPSEIGTTSLQLVTVGRHYKGRQSKTDRDLPTMYRVPHPQTHSRGTKDVVALESQVTNQPSEWH